MLDCTPGREEAKKEAHSFASVFMAQSENGLDETAWAQSTLTDLRRRSKEAVQQGIGVEDLLTSRPRTAAESPCRPKMPVEQRPHTTDTSAVSSAAHAVSAPDNIHHMVHDTPNPIREDPEILTLDGTTSDVSGLPAAAADLEQTEMDVLPVPQSVEFEEPVHTPRLPDRHPSKLLIRTDSGHTPVKTAHDESNLSVQFLEAAGQKVDKEANPLSPKVGNSKRQKKDDAQTESGRFAFRGYDGRSSENIHEGTIFTQEEIDNYREMFEAFDDDGSGDIDCKELGALLYECFKVAPSLALVRDILDELDTDASGTIGFEEFLLLVEHYQQEADKDAEKRAFFSEEEAADYQDLFDAHDVNKSGSLDVNELNPIFKALGKEPRNQAEQQTLAKALAEVDKDGNGTFDFFEFLQLLRRFVDEAEAELLKAEDKAIEKCGFSMEEAESFKEIFTTYDEDQRGILMFADIRKLLRAVGVNMDAQMTDSLRTILAKIDEDADVSSVNFVEFLYLMNHLLDSNFGGLQEAVAKTRARQQEEEQKQQEAEQALIALGERSAKNRERRSMLGC